MTNETILPEHTQKGDMRLKDGKLWICSDPDIDRWVCPDDRGWKLVPFEPTDEMKKAGCQVPLNKAARHNACYKAMLEAAPKFGEEE
ncbi:MAG TPA: hypothetical protein VFC79_07435 [Tissierellaceae bacterium]|nr:hypothetical protein [Tissierellaceae bacterium]